MCLLGEQLHVVLNSDSHWTYMEMVSEEVNCEGFESQLMGWRVCRGSVIGESHWTYMEMVSEEVTFEGCEW